jgi:hypothetical protein
VPCSKSVSMHSWNNQNTHPPSHTPIHTLQAHTIRTRVRTHQACRGESLVRICKSYIHIPTEKIEAFFLFPRWS